MPAIICIETAESICSVAVATDTDLTFYLEDITERNHARVLSGFLTRALQWCRDNHLSPSAVAVSAGPGSYTGLRIGMSEAKGLAYALSIPLIGIPTLEMLARHIALDTPHDPNCIFVPMMDARRMEVYMAAYDSELNLLLTPGPQIIDENSLEELKNDPRKKIYFGSGAHKSYPLVGVPGDILIEDIKPNAKMMISPALQKFRSSDFIDIAYSTPQYLKDFHATTPKPRL